jgi:hypothetical protein
MDAKFSAPSNTNTSPTTVDVNEDGSWQLTELAAVLFFCGIFRISISKRLDQPVNPTIFDLG